MKIRLELDGSITNDEIIIRCRALSEEVQAIQKVLAELIGRDPQFVFYKGDTEFYLPLEDILFFETEEKAVFAHTAADLYQVKHRLYELEEFLPGYFQRVSKSTILNTKKVYSIQRNLSASSIVAFQDTHKQVFVSRHYYKPLKDKLEEKRNRR